ncbi:AAA family ATPase [Actinoplanes couchii]|uniref:LuxR family transcriptional regulator n=1 Tax=Actinoplanes couchii TaxID=403638 RepID=A0ABQ3XTE3_9ACTN|nr:LuxR family transcriptional regulator [Actinoplanes couchii]MDR6318712.1 DNA-binding CsgD family transcriptional regulator [Actinoplanes couchii]GID61783.1 LuxR family transcriptional regulator [Actinoplanes couchii]
MQTPAPIPDVLVGRHAELARLGEVIEAARAGRGAALVVSGEAGIGKSALLEHAVRVAAGFEVVRACGAEFEQELPYAAVHQLCVPVLKHLPALSERHRTALQVAFGLAGGVPDVFHVGLAVLQLMAAARDRPLLCLVDDAQWLDVASARVLAFVGRRVAADRIAVVVAARPPAATGGHRGILLSELPGLDVGRLTDEEAKQLLAFRSPLPLDERVRESLVAEARGNPLALLELPAAGGFLLPGTPNTPIRIEQCFRERFENLPADARSLLVLAAADATGDPGLLWPAARNLGLDVSQAAATDLAEFGARILFCHPLARSAVYHAATSPERRAAHFALAEVTDPDVAPDRRAWHRAQAAGGPDDVIAAELESGASRARARGGVAAAAAFLERSAALTLDPVARIERTLAAVQAVLDAGAVENAAQLLTAVDLNSLDDGQRARAEILQGRIAFTRHGDGTGPMLMVGAARRLAKLDPVRSRECFLDAFEMALSVGRARGIIHEVLTAARSAAPPAAAPDTLDVLVALANGGPRRAIPLVDVADRWWIRRPALATVLTAEFWDFAGHTQIAAWMEKTGRDSGSPVLLRLGLGQAACEAALSGDLGRAVAAIAEEEAIADAIGDAPLMYPRLLLGAFRGRRAEDLPLFRAAAEAEDGRDGGRVTNLNWATAVLHNGLGDYPAALTAARKVIDDGELFHVGGALAELVEAATRCQSPDLAARALESLTEHASAGGTPTALGIAAYSRGLVIDAEEPFVEAVDRLAESPLLPYRGRAHLLYGEWLRRRGRRQDSARHLRTAHELFFSAGAEGFARRAADELRATGDKVRRRGAQIHDELTAREVAVARLVAAGAASQEVATQLFLSKRTVDAHLRSIFRKLGISSRRQLRERGLGTEPAGE